MYSSSKIKGKKGLGKRIFDFVTLEIASVAYLLFFKSSNFSKEFYSGLKGVRRGLGEMARNLLRMEGRRMKEGGGKAELI